MSACAGCPTAVAALCLATSYCGKYLAGQPGQTGMAWNRRQVTESYLCTATVGCID